MSAKLVEKREELATLQDRAKKALEEMGEGLDFDKITVFGDGLDAFGKAEKWRELNEQANELGEEVQKLTAEKYASDVKTRDAMMGQPASKFAHPEPDASTKSLGQRFVESDVYKKNRGDRPYVLDLPDVEVKLLFQTTDGWPPQAVRSGRVVDFPARPIQILDLIPQVPTTQTAFVYMRETTFVQNAAERLEAGAYSEDEYQLTQISDTVRSIGTSLPVTDEQLEDIEGIRAYIDNRLLSSVRRRVDRQVVSGDGVAPNLTGIKNVPGVGTVVYDAIGAGGPERAAELINQIANGIKEARVAGRASPNAVLLHPGDIAKIRQLRDQTTGQWLFQHPSQAGPLTVWGLPFVENEELTELDALTAGAPEETVAIVGDFSGFSQLSVKRGALVELGFVGTQFTSGTKTLRAGMRTAFSVFRAPAFVLIQDDAVL